MNYKAKSWNLIVRLTDVFNDCMPMWSDLHLDVKDAFSAAMDIDNPEKGYPMRLKQMSDKLVDKGWRNGRYSQEDKTICLVTENFDNKGIYMIWLAACVHALEV